MVRLLLENYLSHIEPLAVNASDNGFGGFVEDLGLCVPPIAFHDERHGLALGRGKGCTRLRTEDFLIVSISIVQLFSPSFGMSHLPENLRRTFMNSFLSSR